MHRSMIQVLTAAALSATAFGAAAQKPIIYPAKGQSAKQQQRTRVNATYGRRTPPASIRRRLRRRHHRHPLHPAAQQPRALFAAQ
jgi:hypothetical protein